MKTPFIGALMLWSLFYPAASFSADQTVGGAGELYSIEKRDLLGSHEISAGLGCLPMDAFVKGLTLQGSYAYHFNHLIGWELIGGLWSFNFETDLKTVLKDEFDVQPTELGELRWIIHSNVMIRPLYGKFSLLNDKLIAGEMFFTAGYALGGFTAALPSGINAGAGLRMFIGRYFSVRFDIRDYLFLPNFTSVDNHLFLGLGIGLTFGFSDEQEEE